MDVEPVGVGFGVMSLLFRLTPTYDEPGAGPDTVIVKLAPLHEETRQVARGYDFYRREVEVYRRLGDGIGLRRPRLFFADHDEASDDFVVVMEDLAGHRVCDQLAGCSLEDATLAVTRLAEHHARWWNDPRLKELDFTPSTADPPYPQYNERQTAEAWPPCREKVGHLIPTELVWLGDHFPEIGPRIMEAVDDHPWTLIHGDFRLDNLFFHDDPAGTLTAVDWQISFRAAATSDLGYFMSQSLTVEDRRSHEREILDTYHSTLATNGVTDYPEDELWDDYRRLVLFCFTYPMSAAGQLDLSNERAAALVGSMMERSVAAILDLDALELVPG